MEAEPESPDVAGPETPPPPIHLSRQVTPAGATAAAAALIFLYLLFWPVPIRPVAWEAPANPGYSGVFAANERLSAMDTVGVLGERGPESIAVDDSGRMYFATASGWIVRTDSLGGAAERWANTGGRPLGMAFDASGTLWVADALRGLLSVSPSGAVLVMATTAEGIPIRYADDLDVAPDGRVYLTDASTAFYPPQYDALQASILEVLEHRGTGRVIEYEPSNGRTSVIAAGLVFPNGLAVTHDGTGVLVNEMGNYRVLRIERDGVARGAIEAVVTDLPGFPDNLTRGRDGRYWIALVSPRNGLADWMSDKPMFRKMLLRLPRMIRPGPVHYGHVIAIDSTWRVLADLQDPSGRLESLTHALETPGALWLGSLSAPVAGRVPWRSADDSLRAR
ncbi:SMP-30/gluconolactonase/LRE family protein [Pseudogemmatithrix spongiicola]|uniref:SMP-30/gluconolactonase/LRE family protein n=1 Tax=Pseudogemmatithrix spongiicola TaxID=3062599 RepID=A0AA49Q6S7_9BACT|nr:SMP-30/gluconolactonase/LRE family protein [Gemmatimonadaceae bacterium 'strain 138']WKW14337.1 SMP-30/gluconolactonase/LRE family protein [Gemmatimonadaceae bacterium 'strain 318']